LNKCGTQRLDFAEFYRRSADECLRTVLVSVGDRNAAEELVDEAFARAWASWLTISRHPTPAAWVVRTALNAGISRWRRRQREISVPDPTTVADPLAVGGAADSLVDPRVMAALRTGCPSCTPFGSLFLSVADEGVAHSQRMVALLSDGLRYGTGISQSRS
jgi:DNA-directed RNA polymerase specialized sigma24 family protein